MKDTKQDGLYYFSSCLSFVIFVVRMFFPNSFLGFHLSCAGKGKLYEKTADNNTVVVVVFMYTNKQLKIKVEY